MSRVAHLLLREDFRRVMATPVLVKTPHFALHRQAPVGASALRLGAVTPKRWARHAVTRNALKRQIYCVAELFQAQIPPGDYVVRLRRPFDRSDFHSASSDRLKAAARQELQQLWQKL